MTGWANRWVRRRGSAILAQLRGDVHPTGTVLASGALVCCPTGDVFGLPERLIDTPVGALAVRVPEPVPGRPAPLLWHSLFVDARDKGRVEVDLAEDRKLVMVTGSGHGASRYQRRWYTMADCADAAALVSAALGIGDAVDWVGNAWGGRVGIIFAAHRS